MRLVLDTCIYFSISVSILGISIVSNCSNYASDFTSYTTQTFPGKNVYYYITLEKYMWQSRVEIERYSVAYFDRSTAFELRSALARNFR